MAEIDYGYGDDMGYGDAAPDMGYGDAAPDMGYGDAAPDMGYGDAAPDMGYGAAAPDTDYGYGDAEPEQAPPKDRRPKRRCSVTKFSLATETPLTAASVINDLRMGLAPVPAAQHDDCKSAVTDETGSMDYDQAPSTEPEAPAAPEEPLKDSIKKKGMMSRIRRRLSVAM